MAYRKNLVIAKEEVAIDTSDNSNVSQAVYESEEAAGEMNNFVDNMRRSVEIAESLESIVDIISRKDELTFTEYRIMRVAGEMAVAGTNTDSQALVPSLESSDINIAIESVLEKVKESFVRIGKSFAGLFARFKDWMGKKIFEMRSFQGRLRSIRKRIQNLKTKNKASAENVKIDFNWLAVGAHGEAVKDTAEIRKLCEWNRDFMTNLSNGLTNNMRLVYKNTSIIEAIFNRKDMQDNGVHYFKETLEMAKGMAKTAGMKETQSNRNNAEFVNEQQACGKLVIIQYPNKTDLDNYAAIRHDANLFAFGTVKAKKPDFKQVLLERASLDDIDLCLDQGIVAAEQQCNVLNRNYAEFDKVLGFFNTLPGMLGRVQEVVDDMMFPQKMMTINYTFVWHGLQIVGMIISRFCSQLISLSDDVIRYGRWEEGAQAVE